MTKIVTRTVRLDQDQTPLAPDPLQISSEEPNLDEQAMPLIPATSINPSPGLKARLFASLARTGRFAYFEQRVAELLDIAINPAAVMLQNIERTESWVPGPVPHVDLYHVEGGPGLVGAITGFVKVPPGQEFPLHEHVGQETVLILQGRLRDEDGAEYDAGQEILMSAGSAHKLVSAGQVPLIYLAIVREGIRIGAHFFSADDPQA